MAGATIFLKLHLTHVSGAFAKKDDLELELLQQLDGFSVAPGDNLYVVDDLEVIDKGTAETVPEVEKPSEGPRVTGIDNRGNNEVPEGYVFFSDGLQMHFSFHNGFDFSGDAGTLAHIEAAFAALYSAGIDTAAILYRESD